MRTIATLQPGAILQGGKYEIVRTLGQGGFGITYEAEQVSLHRKVAIKEFFMKEYCERDGSTSCVTLGTAGSKDLVAKFMKKFIREAQMIAKFNHPHIIKIIDVFEENGTAYYVMEFLEGGSLATWIQERGPMSETQALSYVRDIGNALAYIHLRNCLHFDVKPSNVMLDGDGRAVLIDFGVSKHYDEAGHQTSSTPVGISKGYAPLEQYKQTEISTFTPATDVYSLGATLYHVLTGQVPPEASEVNEDGLERPSNISDCVWKAIESAMQPRRKDRPKSVEAFLKLIDVTVEKSDIENTVITQKSSLKSNEDIKPTLAIEPKLVEKRKSKGWLWSLLAGTAISAVVMSLIFGGKVKSGDEEEIFPVDSTAVATTVSQDTLDKPGADIESAASGSIKITSTPSGATIWLDGKNTKKVTPELLKDLSPGMHRIKLEMEGFEDLIKTVEVKEDRVDVSYSLHVQQHLSEIKQVVSGTIAGHDYVDLGLSVKWATCNVGASSPYDYGWHFAWGETAPKTDYTWTSYKYYTSGEEGAKIQFSKYTWIDESQKLVDYSFLEADDDPASVNWGGGWRMPTHKEMEELYNHSYWRTWANENGHKGWRVKSDNGNSIFLPAAGYFDGTQLKDANSGWYWTSTLVFSTTSAGRVTFNSGGSTFSFDSRYRGMSVRPVID